MRSLILSATARLLLPLFLMFSLFLLLRGHNSPGGGFTGGLMAAAGYAIFGMAFGTRRARLAIPLDLKVLAGVGLLVALSSTLVGLAAGDTFFRAVWWEFGGFKMGTPALFDFGVYLVVVGVALTILFGHLEEPG